MATLLVVRHAKAADHYSYARDRDRPLVPRGRGSARRQGVRLAAQGWRPDVVWSSSAPRAAQTADEVIAGLGDPAPVREDLDEMYDASSWTLLDVVRRSPATAGVVAVVAHNPGIADLARHLAGTGELAARRVLDHRFPTATIAVIDVPVAWADLDWGAGHLVEVLLDH